jgi:hypothetical protein
MNASAASHKIHSAHELWFRDLCNVGRAFAFPCDAVGHVDIDGLSERGRNNYFYARAVVGNQLAFPTVQQACDAHPNRQSAAVHQASEIR